MSVRLPEAYGCVSVRGPTAGASVIAAVATSLVTMRRAMTRRRWLMVLISSAPYTSSSAARPGAGKQGSGFLFHLQFVFSVFLDVLVTNCLQPNTLSLYHVEQA